MPCPAACSDIQIRMDLNSAGERRFADRKVLLRWMPSRLSPLVVAAVSAAAAATAADDDDGGGGDDEDDDDNDNDDNYDDDDDAFSRDLKVA